MSHRLLVLALLSGCSVENNLEPLWSLDASTAAIEGAGAVVHVGMSGAACAFSTQTDGRREIGPGADIGFTDDLGALDVAVFDTRDNTVLIAVDGSLAILQDYIRSRKLGVAETVVDAAFTDDSWIALTDDCQLVSRGERAAAPSCGKLETHAGEVWLRGRGTMWPLSGTTAGEPRTISAMYVDPQGDLYEATEAGIVGPHGTTALGAVELFALTDGIGATDRDGQVWRLDAVTGELDRTALQLQPGSILSSDDGWVLVHQTADLTTWYTR